MNERFWEWLRQQYGDKFVEGWKRQVFPFGTGGIPKGLEPAFENWRRNIDTAPVTINPAIYLEAANIINANKFSSGEIDEVKFTENQVEIKRLAGFPTIPRTALFLTEAEPMGEALVYEARAITHLDRLLKGGMISADDYEAQIESVSQVAATGRVDETAPLFKEAQNLPSQVQWESRVKEIESRVPETATPDERSRFLIEAQQRVGASRAELAQEQGLVEFKTEQERLRGAEFEDVGQLDADIPRDYQGKKLPYAFPEAIARGTAQAKAEERGRGEYIPINELPGASGDRARSLIKTIEGMGFSVGPLSKISLREASNEDSPLVAQELVNLSNMLDGIRRKKRIQESELLSKELPEGFKRFQRFRGGLVDPDQNQFEGFTQFVEKDPALKEQLTRIQTQRQTRFPQLSSAFQQSPFEERRKGFSKFITSTPELRSQLEKRTRPQRTRQTSFRPFRGR